MSLPSLYDIEHELSELSAILEASGGDLSATHQGQTLEEWMQTYQLMEAQKADNYAKYIRSLSLAAELISQEEKRLSDKRKVLERKVEQLKESAQRAMEAHGIKKIKGEIFSFSLIKSGRPSVVLKVDAGLLPEQFRKVEVTADKNKLREALENGDKAAAGVAELTPPKTFLAIR